MNVSVEGAFVYFVIPIFGGIPITQTTVSSLVVTIVLCTAGILLGRRLTKRPGGVQVLVEKAVGMLYNLVSETMGPHNTYWAPYIGTVFLSSICGTLIGMTGFLRSTTADLSTTLTWAVMTSVIIWYNSIKRNGFIGWLKGFTEPVAVMTPMNIVSEIAQPVSMAFRLFGNVMGGGVITSVLYAALSTASAAVLNLIAGNGLLVCLIVTGMGIAGLAVSLKKKKKLIWKLLSLVLAVVGALALLQYFGVASNIPILQIGLPAVLSLYFDLFSGLIQAFVFCLLSMVYISSACPALEEAEQ